jgi:hypothetical protein
MMAVFFDVLNSAPGSFQIFFVIILAVIVFGIIMSVVNYSKNASAPVLQVWAKVVGKRTQVTGHTHMHGHGHAGGHNIHHNSTSTRYYVTFEMEDRQRMELTANGRQYGLLAEGDTGLLTYQGEWFKDFVRD